MKKILLITLVSLIVNTNIIYAECTTKDKEYYESIKDKYNISYEFDKDTKAYKLYLTYGDDSAFSYEIEGDIMDNVNYEFKDNTTIISNITPGEYILRVIGVSDSCSDTFREETITLPKYNEYAYDPICEGIEEFVLCSPTYDKEIDYETFISRANTYRKNKEKGNDTTDDEKGNKNTITEWFKNNYQYIIYGLIGIAVLIMAIIIIKIIYNKERKRRRLE